MPFKDAVVKAGEATRAVHAFHIAIPRELALQRPARRTLADRIADDRAVDQTAVGEIAVKSVRVVHIVDERAALADRAIGNAVFEARIVKKTVLLEMAANDFRPVLGLAADNTINGATILVAIGLAGVAVKRAIAHKGAIINANPVDFPVLHHVGDKVGNEVALDIRPARTESSVRSRATDIVGKRALSHRCIRTCVQEPSSEVVVKVATRHFNRCSGIAKCRSD